MRRFERIACAWLVAVAVLVSPRAASADEQLRYQLSLDVPITAIGGAAWLGSEAFKAELVRADCRWCEVNAFDASVRRALKWDDIERAHDLSNLTGFILTPVAVFGLTAWGAAQKERIDGYPADALLILEATVIAVDLNQVVKFLVARERPFVHALPPELKAQTEHPADNNLSFFSGHTTLTFALAASSGTIASMRGYRSAPWVWAGGLTLAATTGYLRIAGDRHYLTDVIVGAIVGSAIGAAIPLAFHAP